MKQEIKPHPLEIIPVEPLVERPATPAERLRNVPWWFVAIILIAIYMAYVITSQENFGDAFNFIIIGIRITIQTSVISYAFALVLGLLAGMGRISKNVVIRNAATLYVELIRGIPMLVLIFYIALVGVPSFVEALNGLGRMLSDAGLPFVGAPLEAI